MEEIVSGFSEVLAHEAFLGQKMVGELLELNVFSQFGMEFLGNCS